MKTVLVALNARYNHINPAVRSLMASAPEHQVEILEAGIQDRPFDLFGKIIRSGAEAVGFSVYIWNIDLVRRLTAMLRQGYPELIVFWGGPEAGGDPACEFQSCPETDFIVRGEAESVFPEILNYLEQGGIAELKAARIQGVNFPGQAVTTTIPVDVSTLPMLDPATIENLSDRIVYIEGQRGCPYSCSYCMSSETGHLRVKQPEAVLAQTRLLAGAGATLIKFTDRTFNARSAFSETVVRGLIDEWQAGSRNTRYHFELSADILTDRLIDMLCTAPAGLFQIEAGVQSTDAGVLNNVSRKQKTEKVLQNAAAIAQSGHTHIHLDLIAGLPGETYEKFICSFNETCTLFPDMLQLGFLKLLKGTKLRSAAEQYGICFDRYPPYEIIANDAISAGELTQLRLFEGVFDRFYNSGRYPHYTRFVLGEESQYTPFEYYRELMDFLERKGMEGKALSPGLQASLLSEFLVEHSPSALIGDRDTAAQLLAADLLQSKTAIPDILKNILPDSFIPEKNRAFIAWLDLEEVRSLIAEHFPDLKMRSGKYLVRDLCFFRLSGKARQAADFNSKPIPGDSAVGKSGSETAADTDLYVSRGKRVFRIPDRTVSLLEKTEYELKTDSRQG